jgi:hypothetical protein
MEPFGWWLSVHGRRPPGKLCAKVLKRISHAPERTSRRMRILEALGALQQRSVLLGGRKPAARRATFLRAVRLPRARRALLEELLRASPQTFQAARRLGSGGHPFGAAKRQRVRRRECSRDGGQRERARHGARRESARRSDAVQRSLWRTGRPAPFDFGATRFCR